MTNLTAKIYHDEDAARAHLEAQRWPDGVVCPHCQSRDVTKLEGKAARPGVYQCKTKPCREQFTVTVGTVMERSHIPLAKWVMAIQLMASSKKGISAKQIERMLGVSYRSAWFLMHRIREAMSPVEAGEPPIGGKGKTVESDETFVGGKAQNAHANKPIPKKHAVHALVERGGKVRAKHVPNVTAKTLREAIKRNVAKGTTINTDDALAYYHMGKEFAAHGVVNHSAGEYVSKDGKTHINTAEAFFAILKRGVMGSFHSISEKHLDRYVQEFAFRWNHRQSLGVEDLERAAAIVKASEGKRLTYRRIGGEEEGAR
jgi:transposase-like protein